MQARSARSATTVAVLLAGLLWFPAATSAAGLTISPVVVQIDSPRKPVAITISNQSDRPITLQADTKVWLQVDGIDQYAPTDELLVVPAIAQVPPNGSQVFRIALRRPSGAPVERTYRLILEDISEEQRPSQTSAVSFKLTHNLPVMVAPSAPLVTAVRWTPCASKPSQACVRVVNTGNYRLKVQGLTLAGDGWRHALPLKAPQIILAGAAREWQVPLAPAEAGAVRGVQVHSAQGATLEAEGGKSS